MDSEKKCNQLAEKIRKILGCGITLENDVVHYIDSTFSNPTTAELETILQDDSNCEKDPLMELLLYPDESIQLRLEALLERLQFSAAEEQFVPYYLFREPIPVRIRFPDDRESLSLIVTEDIACQLITRLHISKHLDGKLLEVINKSAEAETRDGYKVKIRNSRFSPDQNKIQFLCDFFEKLESPNPDFNTSLDFALSWLDELAENQDLYQALMSKKRFYLRSLQKAKKLETQLLKNNLETLLSQGKRVILVDKEDARKKIWLIDKISRAVFGKTEYSEPFHSVEEHIELSANRNSELEDTC